MVVSSDVNIKHVIEDKPLNTAGALRQLEGELIGEVYGVLWGYNNGY